MFTYPISQANAWSFIVMSDIHIYPSGRIPEKFEIMVNYVKEKNPDIVFITGDHTNGNRGDSHSNERVNYWYEQLDKALAPLFEKGIIIVPTVGNHDFYEPKHKQAYTRWAKKTLNKSKSVLGIHGDNPLYFNFEYKGQEFFILKLWTQQMKEKQSNWFINNTIHPPKNNRFAFGHVPLKSIRGRTVESFYEKVGPLFAKGFIDIYFSGHEHMHWDEYLPFLKDGKDFRQLTVGTTSGTYNHAIRKPVRDIHCDSNTCISPATLKKFRIESRDGRPGYQVFRQNFIEVTFLNNEDYKIDSFSLDKKDKLVDFYIE